ncbi:MAG: hypothetical protein GXO48_00625 [Chlorobi bacterium]|nr:hypothetical protein [Chlorobiota bacterium]
MKWKTSIIAREDGGRFSGSIAGSFAVYNYIRFNAINPFSEFEESNLLIQSVPKENDLPKRLENWKLFINECKEALTNELQDNKMLIFSGDHSGSAGIFASFKEALKDEKIGLLWIDAHADLHTPYTSPSLNPHGMPVGAILNLDAKHLKRRDLPIEIVNLWDEIKDATGSLSPEDVFFLGLRSVEKEESTLIRELDLECVSAHDINFLDIDGLAQRILDFFDGYDAIYISFDIDALDSYYVPGTGTPVPSGLTPEFLIELFDLILPKLPIKIFEITEYNSLLDIQGKTLNTIIEIIKPLGKHFEESA